MKLKTFVALTLLAAALVSVVGAGENLNGIYLGECSLDAPSCTWAVQITPDGTVHVRRGMTVPMTDFQGRQVVIRRVEIK